MRIDSGKRNCRRHSDISITLRTYDHVESDAFRAPLNEASHDPSTHFFQKTHPLDELDEIAYAPIEQVILNQLFSQP
jgi:hypothetical protein